MDETEDLGQDENSDEGDGEEPRSRVDFCPTCRHDRPGHNPGCPYADPWDDTAAT